MVREVLSIGDELGYELNDLIRYGENLDEILEDGRQRREQLAEEWLRVRDKEGCRVPFLLNRAQRAYADSCTKRNIVLKARQLGITTLVASRFFLQTITRPGTVTVQVAHDQGSAEQIFGIVRRFVQNLPEELRKGELKTSHANVRQIVFPKLDSEYRVETAGNENAGRGLTIRNLHCSEVARWPGDAGETLASLRAAVPPDGEVVLESTPNGAGGCFYSEWHSAPERGYTRHFLPWWWDDGYRSEVPLVGSLDEEEAELVEQEGLTLEQIAYRRQLMADYGRLARQEFAENAEECFLASGECIFDVECIEKRITELGRPQENLDNGRIEIYYPQVTGHEYVIGVDPAGGGIGGDYAAAEVVDRRMGVQCAELRGHYRPAELATQVAELGKRYNNARIAVERNNHGAAVIVALEHVKYPNLYEQSGQVGWLTTSASRPRMLEQLAAKVRHETGGFESRRFLEECKTFVRRHDGSAAAANGAHDDLVMAMAVAVACG